ncbi:S9 family peptidase [Pseudoxanthomonas daejeonensis]|uniref:alpha/beta hydrolase family protein n=1 Tax=Pseudoxanthomonas daejeonensis TaxID=266062 RepID=UPI001F547E63|nr:S9 family peptidase [Pseudoxanthomonas daejeonensis]UNK56675.1 S9 family peptidase [Pseudoxanthomonas daejeonensis]
MIRSKGAGAARMLCMVLGLCFWSGAVQAATTVEVDQFIRKAQFRDVKLSPDGTYLAATLPGEDRTTLVILRLSDMKVSAHFALGRDTDIADFHWVNPGRVLLSVAQKFGRLAQPQPTGEIFGVNADGGRAGVLVGQRASGKAGTRIQPRQPALVWARLVDDLPEDDRYVILTVGEFSEAGFTRAERMDVNTGARIVVAKVPVANASFATDHDGVVRFAWGTDSDNRSRLYYRAGEGADWSVINDQARSGRAEYPVGFSADGATAYLRVSHVRGPDSIVALHVADGGRREVLRDDTVDPHQIVYATSGPREPIGALFMAGTPRTVFFKPDHPDARLQRSLEPAFEGELVRVLARTGNGDRSLLLVTSDRNSGDFFLFDHATRNAERLVSRREWLDPMRMVENRPVSLRARDGLALHGYLTVPAGSDGRGLPMVLLPHGGPYGVKDSWEFDDEPQLLAAAGYAVLRVNFRGSGGYGNAFTEAGARQWGLAMQDDLTDATRWAISEGIADPARICIYGASYGAYAALAGVAREPALYRCAAGYVGVYDLVERSESLVDRGRWMATWSREWIGDDRAALLAVSPNHLADRIRVPVFLAAGGQDTIAPPAHTRKMEAALQRAGVPVESLYYPDEGHGFYTEAHQREYYSRLLAFLDRHIGAGAKP